MNKFFFSLLFIIFLDGNTFDEWIKINKNLLKHKNKLVTFNLAQNENNSEVLYGEISLGHDNTFRFKMGSRTVISDGESWKSYDSNTNQIFIQDRDVKFEKLLFSWSMYKKIKSLKVKKQINGSCEIKLPGFKQNIYAFIDPKLNILDSIFFVNQSKYHFFNISISKLDSMDLSIGLESSDIFDLR